MFRLPQRASAARGLLVVTIVLGVFLGCDANSVINQGLSQDCFNGSCLVYKTWGQNIDAYINKQAVGYSYIIMNHGLLMASNSFGQARTSADAPQTAMTADLPSNIASVTKTITGVALLKLLSDKQVSVTSAIAPYLPKSWTLGAGDGDITFAQLLTHTSGIRDTLNPDTSYANLQATMTQDILPANKVYKYQNANFGLMRIIIPYLNGFNDAGVADIASATDQLYQTYLRSVYGNDFPITCKPHTGNPPQVLSYAQGATNGTDWGDWTDLCGAGGLQLTVNDMGVFLAHLMAGIYLPAPSSGTPPANPTTNTLSAMVSNSYAWDFTWPNTHGTCVEKNGDLGAGNPFVPYLSTLMVYCPDTGLGFVGLANSTLPARPTHSYGFTGALDDIVFDAYNASWKPQS